jgi:hypothetical protein
MRARGRRRARAARAHTSACTPLLRRAGGKRRAYSERPDNCAQMKRKMKNVSAERHLTRMKISSRSGRARESTGAVLRSMYGACETGKLRAIFTQTNCSRKQTRAIERDRGAKREMRAQDARSLTVRLRLMSVRANAECNAVGLLTSMDLQRQRDGAAK